MWSCLQNVCQSPSWTVTVLQTHLMKQILSCLNMPDQWLNRAWYAGGLQRDWIGAKKTASSQWKALTGLQTAGQNYDISTIYLRYISENICTYVNIRYGICQSHTILRKWIWHTYVNLQNWICKSTESNIQIYRTKYANLQNWIWMTYTTM